MCLHSAETSSSHDVPPASSWQGTRTLHTRVTVILVQRHIFVQKVPRYRLQSYNKKNSHVPAPSSVQVVHKPPKLLYCSCPVPEPRYKTQGDPSDPSPKHHGPVPSSYYNVLRTYYRPAYIRACVHERGAKFSAPQCSAAHSSGVDGGLEGG